MILGIDVSTSTTGLAVIDEHGELIHSEAVVTTNKRKFPDLFEVANLIESRLIEVKKQFDIKSIYIEPALMSFSPGKSRADVIAILQKINGMVSLLSFQIFKIKPQYIEARSARSKLKIKVPKGKKGNDAKQSILEQVLALYPAFVVESTRTGSVAARNYDRADALVIARAGWLNEETR